MKKRLVVLALILVLCSLALPASAAQNICKFDRTVTTLFEGETLQTVLLLEGAPAAGTVTYTSNATRNAVVDDNGLVTGVSKGYVTITATVKGEKNTWKANIQLNVLRKVEEITVKEEKLPFFSPDDPEVQGLYTVAEDEDVPAAILVLRLGHNQSIQAVCQPGDANDRRFTLHSSDEKVVSVNSNTLRPRALGQCDVTVASRQNPEVSVTYRAVVVQPVTRLQIEAEGKSLYVGETLQLRAEYTPENAGVKAVTWSSSNTKAAVVDENGVVTGVGKGSATIRCLARDGSGRSASCSVTVMQQPQGIALRESEITVNIGSYKTLYATVEPSNANNKKVEWLSSDESIARVNQSGRVTPVAPGSCTITCRSKDFPEVYAAAAVNVHQLVTKLSFYEKEVSFNVNTSMQVFWEVAPANATNQAVTFSSNKTSVATVDENGVITGHKKGECYITVKAADGSNKSARIKVNILQPVEGVHMKNDTITVGVDETVTAVAEMEPANASNNRMTWYSADSSIATVSGTRNKPSVRGHRWGTTAITGVTEDGGFVTTATVKVGNYDKALKITDLYLSDNRIKIVVNNESNMNIARFSYTISCFDVYGQPLPCNIDGSNTFRGSYRYTLYEGESTQHGKFYFGDFIQPADHIARVTMQITAYSTDDGYSRTIKEHRQVVVEFKTAAYVGATPTPVPEATAAPAQ